MPHDNNLAMLLRRAADAMEPDRRTPAPEPAPSPADAMVRDA